MSKVYGIQGLVNAPPEVLTGYGPPNPNFQGQLGQFYYDISTSPFTLYQFNGTTFTGGTVVVPVTPSQGGTGLISPAAHQLMVTEGASNFNLLGVAGNGQIPIGSAGADPVLANITAGVGVTVVNGPGSITISSTAAGTTWTPIAASQTLAVNNGYICSGGGALILTLPAVSSVGDIIEITLDGSASFSVHQGAGQTIKMGNQVTTAGVGGSLSSSQQGDSLRMVCSVANLRWNILSSMGNLTVV
jgi:hypothetical protein